MKLGKLAPKPHPRTLKLAKYTASLPAPHRTWAWEYDVPSWPMLLNDRLGDCTCACAGHMIQDWTVRTYGMVTPTDQQIQAAYSAIGGYVPGDASTDNGCAITDVLSYWQNNGIADRKILAWAEIDIKNLTAVKQAIQIFGGIDIGFNVPQSAMDEFSAGKPWDNTKDTNIVGGHSVPVFSYGSLGCTCVTWGQLQPMSWDFWAKYVDEAYAIVTLDFLTSAQKSPILGLDIATLQADLQTLQTT